MPAAPASHPPTETCQTFLEAAIFCFAEKGFDGASIRDIAARAGKHVSLIGYHFGSKDGLYLSCFRHIFNRFPRTPLPVQYRDLEAIRRDRSLATEALRAAILATMKDLFEQADDPLKQASVRLFIEEMHSPRALLHDLYRERIGDSIELLKACIATLRPDLPEAEVAFLGQCIQGQCLIHRLAGGLHALVWRTGLPDASPAALADRIADFALAGLTHPPPGRP